MSLRTKVCRACGFIQPVRDPAQPCARCGAADWKELGQEEGQ